MAIKTQRRHQRRKEARRRLQERSPQPIKRLPDEIVIKMVQHMDGPTSVCFALTSHRHYDIVADRIGPHFTIFKFKTLRPFCMEIWVHRLGEEEHEKFIRQLWTWLGGRCVYCGITKELCKQDSGAMFTTEFEKERLKASVDILSGLTGLDGYCGRSVGRRIQDIRREVETSVRLIPDPASLGI